MARYPGRKGVIYMSTSGSGTATAVLGASKFNVDYSTQMLDTTCFGDTNRTFVPSLPDCKGSLSGLWDDSETKIFTAASSSDGCLLYLYPSSDAPTKYWSGAAWINLKMDVDVNGTVAISGDFAAKSSWSKTF